MGLCRIDFWDEDNIICTRWTSVAWGWCQCHHWGCQTRRGNCNHL